MIFPLAAAAVCCLLALLCTLRSRPSGKVPMGSLANGDRANGDVAGKERQVGGSMMEQLVPEIRTHALSYLDYPSLCRLSMTNSAMRRAANDDNAWKALYHKDFTTEQGSINPANGWKAYYAATKAVINANTEFYNTIRERSLATMSRLWLNADYVKCIHGAGLCFMGHTAVIGSWAMVFNWVQHDGLSLAFDVQDVRARVLGDMAWVSMTAHVDVDAGPYHVTNVYEFKDGHWYVVHHHRSIMFIEGDIAQQNIFG